jgi:hypothetical protein
MMNHNLPTLTIRFEIDKAGGGYYGLTCWKTFWQAVDPANIGGVSLFEGDSDATLNGRERVFLIGVQTIEPSTLSVLKQALSSSEAFIRVAATPMFLEEPGGQGEPLVKAGEIDRKGNLLGTIGAASSALGELQRERRQPLDATPATVLPRVIPFSSRTTDLPEVASLAELEALAKKRFTPPDIYEYASMWLNPEELCDFVERYESQILIQWYEYGPDILRITVFWKNPQLEHCIEFRGFCPSPTPAEAVNRLTGEWKAASSYDRNPSVRRYVDALPQLADIQGRYQRNFEGQGNGGLFSYYEDPGQLPVRDLWPRLCQRAEQLGLPMSRHQTKARSSLPYLGSISARLASRWNNRKKGPANGI